MTLRARLIRVQHALLRFLLPEFRTASAWQAAHDLEFQHHQIAKAARLSAEASLVEARHQIATLTTAARNASELADRYRIERDESREREAASLRLLADKLNPVVDLLAVKVLGRQVYGTLPSDAAPPADPDQNPMVSRGRQAKHVVRESTMQVLKDLDEQIKLQQMRTEQGAAGPMAADAAAEPQPSCIIT